ncbi:hypothetical protein [Ruminococcus albus]|uniref:Uncharacterized protein n=1 Tax=Ruminococcus albus TaxID=1264 RepID=A0A1H7GLN5_RUMAL|nr:hypothetical protein [Ruminococcus albus]SEK37892.1 hypothetical protein SAMN05216469_102122 [Ruminococcus albus]
MKIKYTYRSDYLRAVIIWGTSIIICTMAVASVVKNEIVLLSLCIFMCVFFVIWVYFSWLLCNLPVEMVARKKTLKVTVLFRETVIRYSDIESINIEREFRKAEMRGERDCYNEILTITDIHKKEYVYYRKINIDYDKVAADPDELKKKFENSKFAKLKAYIEEQMKFEKRLGINLQNIHGDR